MALFVPCPFLASITAHLVSLLFCASWQTRFAGTWVCPKRPDQDAARLDVKVQSPAGDQAFTVGSWDGVNKEQIGFVSQYGNTAKSIIITRTEGMLGVTGEECNEE